MGERYTNVHTSSDVTVADAVEQRYISVSEATRRLNALQRKADLLDEAVGLGSELREALDMGPTIRELCKPDIEGLCDRFDAFLARIKEADRG